MSKNLFPRMIEFIKSLYPNENPVPLHEPRFSGNEKRYVLDCIDSTFVSSVGEYVDRFEEMICRITGTAFAVATVNGTCALHIALKLAGVQPGDEVSHSLSALWQRPMLYHIVGQNPFSLM